MADRVGLPECSCVVVLRAEDGAGRPLTEIIREMAPLEKQDLLAEDGAGRALMIKAGEDPDEIAEFVLAMMNTVDIESGIRLKAGISDVHRAPEEWPAGYREALEALEMGDKYHPRAQVQVYGHQFLERMMEQIPEETRVQMRRHFFGEHPEQFLTEETLETAEQFFEADLNLSVAARQMFVHRNTLTYRLDRIQKETGLNLRSFRDAAVFRMLMMMPEERNR